MSHYQLSPEQKLRKKIWSKQYYLKKQKVINERNKAWHAANPERRKAINRAHYLEHKSKILARNKLRRLLKPAEIKLARDKWEAINKDRVRAKQTVWDRTNAKRRTPIKTAQRKARRQKLKHTDPVAYNALLQKERKWGARWYAANKEKARAATKRWEAHNRERLLSKHSARAAAKLEAAIPEELIVIQAWEISWRKKHSVRCYWCGNTFPGKDCHSDHITPLSRNGLHSLANLCIACPSCNLRKHAKPLDRWNSELTSPVLF